MPIVALPTATTSAPMSSVVMQAQNELVRLLEGDLFYFEKHSLINAVLVHVDRKIAEAIKTKDISDPPSIDIAVGMRIACCSLGCYMSGESSQEDVLDSLRSNSGLLFNAIGELDRSLSNLKALKRKFPKSAQIDGRIAVIQNLKTLFSAVRTLTASGAGLDVLIKAPSELSQRMHDISDKDGKALLQAVELRYHSLLRCLNANSKICGMLSRSDDPAAYGKYVAGLRMQVEASYQEFQAWKAKGRDREPADLERIRTDLATKMSLVAYSPESHSQMLNGVMAFSNSIRGLNESLKLAMVQTVCSKTPITDEDLYEIVDLVEQARILGVIQSIMVADQDRLRKKLTEKVTMDRAALNKTLNKCIKLTERTVKSLLSEDFLRAQYLALSLIRRNDRSFVSLSEIRDLIFGVFQELLEPKALYDENHRRHAAEMLRQLRPQCRQDEPIDTAVSVELVDACEPPSAVSEVDLVPHSVAEKAVMFLFKQLGERQKTVSEIFSGHSRPLPKLDLDSPSSCVQASSSQPVSSSSEASSSTEVALADGGEKYTVQVPPLMSFVEDLAYEEEAEIQLEKLLDSGQIKDSFEVMSRQNDEESSKPSADGASAASPEEMERGERIDKICKHIKDSLYASKNRKVVKVIGKLKANGFNFVRQVGSHQIWRHPLLSRPIVLAAHPGELVNRNTMKDIEEQLKVLESIKSLPVGAASSSPAKEAAATGHRPITKSRGRSRRG